MANPNPTPPPEETRWQPGQSGNPNGKPKGTIHLSTRIQRMLDDDEFTTELVKKDGTRVTFKGNPADAIIKTAILKAMGGDNKWAEWLAKNGFGTKQIHEFQNNPIQDILEKYGLGKPGAKEEPKPSAIPDKADPNLMSMADGSKPPIDPEAILDKMLENTNKKGNTDNAGEVKTT